MALGGVDFEESRRHQALKWRQNVSLSFCTGDLYQETGFIYLAERMAAGFGVWFVPGGDGYCVGSNMMTTSSVQCGQVR